MTKGNSYLSNHVLSLILSKSSVLYQMSEKLTTFNEIHNEENSKLVLENIVHTNNEWVANCIENFLFKLQRINIFILKDDIFSDRFHSVKFLVSTMLHKENLTECSFTNHFNYFEVLKLRL